MMELRTFTIKDRQLADDHTTLFVHDPEDNFYLCKKKELFEQLNAGEQVMVYGEAKKSKQGNPYFQILSVGEEEPSHKEPEPPKYQPDDHKDRGVALRYAVDAWIADKITKEEVTKCADRFVKYIKGE